MFDYACTPFIAWLIAGCLKFIVNSLKARKLAFGLIGYGGLPSNHSAIVTSTATLIALNEGINHPAFGVAVTLAFIIMLDASSLRREVGKHAAKINQLSRTEPTLRERMGHTPFEILAGIVVGISVACAIHCVPTWH
jgi:acid phosphatase family membrane protein YuiD